jgi:hypothetical protein
MLMNAELLDNQHHRGHLCLTDRGAALRPVLESVARAPDSPGPARCYGPIFNSAES